MSFKILWGRVLELTSKSDITAVVYRKLLGGLKKMHDWFTKHKRKLPQPILWLIHVCTHSYIYSNILFFNKCTLMKTATNTDGYLIQLKVLTWIHSWLCLTVSSPWSLAEVMKKFLPWMEFYQRGRIFAEVEVMGILWRRGAVGTTFFLKEEMCV